MLLIQYCYTQHAIQIRMAEILDDWPLTVVGSLQRIGSHVEYLLADDVNLIVNLLSLDSSNLVHLMHIGYF